MNPGRGASRSDALANPESRHRLDQPAGMVFQAFGSGGALFNQCGVLLCHLVELGDGAVDMGDTVALFARRDAASSLAALGSVPRPRCPHE
jgi:hypothetical protein